MAKIAFPSQLDMATAVPLEGDRGHFGHVEGICRTHAHPQRIVRANGMVQLHDAQLPSGGHEEPPTHKGHAQAVATPWNQAQVDRLGGDGQVHHPQPQPLLGEVGIGPCEGGTGDGRAQGKGGQHLGGGFRCGEVHDDSAAEGQEASTLCDPVGGRGIQPDHRSREGGCRGLREKDHRTRKGQGKNHREGNAARRAGE